MKDPTITCWYKYNKSKDEYIFNHIEDGYSFEDKPLPKSEKFTAQNDWKNYQWMRTFGQLTKDGLVELENSKYPN